MKRPRPTEPKPPPEEDPDWMLDAPLTPGSPMSGAELRELARGVWKGIRDTPAWKKLVQERGRAEAQRILRVAVYRYHGIRPDGTN